MAGGAEVHGTNKRKRDGKPSSGKCGGGGDGAKRNKSYDAPAAPRGGGGGGQPVTARDKRVAAKVQPVLACFLSFDMSLEHGVWSCFCS
jgi:hypothetical protein